ncbi:unnamed protein product [Fraxinus pennsylvanica]|uniref:BRCT domain-containing protein n=1 Tax=Fraxinus pennsylvanica TaxID=56036 RepID=A0AAD1Z454_9LAMI|nr:unnamed protein product [Fraxinus pennsylvanica]
MTGSSCGSRVISVQRFGFLGSLHLVCSFHGHKFEHALRHGPTNGLLLVTIGWFFDSVRRKVRLSESLYSISVGKVDDPDVSAELHNKDVEAVTTQGATLVDQWFVGCSANYVVCEEL